MDLFRHAAPLFRLFGDRWDDESIATIVRRLEPYLGVRRQLLDLGGGTGALAARLADALDVHVTVLDPSPEMIAQSRGHRRVSAVVGSAESMPFATAEFDACIISDAFHHFRDQEGAMTEIVRVVRPSGGLHVLEFDGRGWMKLIVWGEKLLGEPGAFMSPEELCAFMAAHGVEGECERGRGAAYHFLGTVGEQGHAR